MRHPAQHHLSGNFAQGSLAAITGSLGAGEGTLLKCMPCSADQPPASATGLPAPASELNPSFPMAVRDCMLVGLWSQTGHPVDGGYEIELAGVANER